MTLSCDWSPVTGGSSPRLVIAWVGQYCTHNPQYEHWPAKKFQVIPVSCCSAKEIALGEQTYSAGPATSAQAYILLDQPAKGRRARRHVVGAPRPRAMAEIPPDDIENAHPVLPLADDRDDHRRRRQPARPRPNKTETPASP